jgi:predicted ATPase
LGARGRILQGWADAQKGQATAGIARIRDGLAASEATGTRVATSLSLTLLAEALALAGKIEEGLATLDDAAKAAVSGESGCDAEIHRLRGELTGRLPYPDPAKAEDSFRTALAIAREQGTRGYELRAATSLARLWREQGRRGEARELLAPLYGWFTEGLRHHRPEGREAAARRVDVSQPSARLWPDPPDRFVRNSTILRAGTNVTRASNTRFRRRAANGRNRPKEERFLRSDALRFGSGCSPL